MNFQKANYVLHIKAKVVHRIHVHIHICIRSFLKNLILFVFVFSHIWKAKYYSYSYLVIFGKVGGWTAAAGRRCLPVSHCGNSVGSDKGIRRIHKSQELLQPERMRSQDFVNSKNVSPLKDVREEEVTYTQVFRCDTFDYRNNVHCGEEFESEDNLEDHTDNLRPFVWCPGCKHSLYDCDDAAACPGFLRPWPGWRSRPR